MEMSEGMEQIDAEHAQAYVPQGNNIESRPETPSQMAAQRLLQGEGGDTLKKGVVIGGSESGSQHHPSVTPGKQLQLRHKAHGLHESPGGDEQSQFSQSGIDEGESQAASPVPE